MRCRASSCSVLFTPNLFLDVIDDRNKVAEFDVVSGVQRATIARSYELIVLNAYRDPRTSNSLDRGSHVFAYHQVGLETQDFTVDVIRLSGGYLDTWSQHSKDLRKRFTVRARFVSYQNAHLRVRRHGDYVVFPLTL